MFAISILVFNYFVAIQYLLYHQDIIATVGRQNSKLESIENTTLKVRLGITFLNVWK